MNFIRQLEQFQTLNKLIEQERTGSPEQLADRLNISKTKLYELIDDLKSLGKKVQYSRRGRTFYYEDSAKLDISFSLKLIKQEEIKNIHGGTIFFLPSFFLNGTPLYLSLYRYKG